MEGFNIPKEEFLGKNIDLVKIREQYKDLLSSVNEKWISEFDRMVLQAHAGGRLIFGSEESDRLITEMASLVAESSKEEENIDLQIDDVVGEFVDVSYINFAKKVIYTISLSFSLSSLYEFDRIADHLTRKFSDKPKSVDAIKFTSEIREILKTSIPKKREDQIKQAKELTDTLRLMPKVESAGFKISEEQFLAMVDTLPNGFIASVATINCTSEVVGISSEKYGITGFEVAHFSRNDREIVFSGASYDNTKESILEIFTHEYAHSVDWLSNYFLTTEDKIDLLQKIADRVLAEDRFKSSYVESIKSADINQEILVRAQEYFAEIVSAYLTDGFVALPEEDRKIVSDFIKKVDPNFDRESSLQKRKEILGIY